MKNVARIYTNVQYYYWPRLAEVYSRLPAVSRQDRQTEAMYISAESKTGDVLTEAKTLVVFAREMCGSGQTDGNERSCDANAQLPGEHPARDVAPVDLRDVQAQSGAVH